MFSEAVTDSWLPSAAAGHAGDADSYQIVRDDTLPEDRPLTVLQPVGRVGTVAATSGTIESLGLAGETMIDDQSLARTLAAENITLNGADYLFYLPIEERSEARAEHLLATTRQLHDTDADSFAAVSAQAPEKDLQEAFVELDHWLVFGTFADDALATAGSAYPWRDSRLAEIGILTLPAHRGRGLGNATVRALSAAALQRGYEPQYRCQVTNTPSAALARSAGFGCFGTWDVIDSAPPRPRPALGPQ